jgi:hypothetical protein
MRATWKAVADTSPWCPTCADTRRFTKARRRPGPAKMRTRSRGSRFELCILARCLRVPPFNLATWFQSVVLLSASCVIGVGRIMISCLSDGLFFSLLCTTGFFFFLVFLPAGPGYVSCRRNLIPHQECFMRIGQAYGTRGQGGIRLR